MIRNDDQRTLIIFMHDRGRDHLLGIERDPSIKLINDVLSVRMGFGREFDLLQFDLSSLYCRQSIERAVCSNLDSKCIMQVDDARERLFEGGRRSRFGGRK